jgi:hypothetical protein
MEMCRGHAGKKLLDININIDTIQTMAKIEDILVRMKKNPSDVRFSDLSKVCIYYFGQARQKDGSHHVYKTPWQGDPRINIQNHKGKAKAYQVKQVLLAIEKLEVEHAAEK